MFKFTIDLGNLTDWLSLIVSVMAFSSGILVLWLAKRNIDALLLQMRSQVAHNVIESHKTLYMPIVQDPALAEMIAGKNAEEYRRKMLASMLINHAGKMFQERQSGTMIFLEEAEFKADVADFLTLPVVRNRWPEVKAFHPADFVKFVDECIAISPAVEAEHSPPPHSKMVRKSARMKQGAVKNSAPAGVTRRSTAQPLPSTHKRHKPAPM